MSWLTKYNLKEDPFGTAEIEDQQIETLFEDRTEIEPLICSISINSQSKKFGIRGQPGVGKTTALKKMLYSLKSNQIIPLKIDMSRPVNEDDLLIWYTSTLVEQIQSDYYNLDKNIKTDIFAVFKDLYYSVEVKTGSQQDYNIGISLLLTRRNVWVQKGSYRIKKTSKWRSRNTSLPRNYPKNLRSRTHCRCGT